MKVLSLFDSITCWMIALLHAGFKVDRVTTADFTHYRDFDLLIGGSPCQPFGIVQSNTDSDLKAKARSMI